MGRPRRAWVASFAVLVAVVAALAWRAIPGATSMQGGDDETKAAPETPARGAVGLSARPRWTSPVPRVVEPVIPADAGEWEVVPEALDGPRLVVETAPPPLDEGRYHLGADLIASSPRETRWIGVGADEGEAPWYFYGGTSSFTPPLATVSEGGTLQPDGSWAIRTSLTRGRWLVHLELARRAWSAPVVAWAWADAGAEEPVVRLQPADAEHMGRLRIWARGPAHPNGRLLASVRCGGCVWTQWRRVAATEVEAAEEETLVPPGEDLSVQLSGADGREDAIVRVVRIAAGKIETVGFEVPPAVDVHLTVLRPGPWRGPASVRVWRTEVDGRVVRCGAWRAETPDVFRGRLAPGRYLAVASGPALSGTAMVPFDATPPDPVFVDLPLVEHGVRARLRVHDAEGRPAPGLPLRVGRFHETDPERVLEADVTTDAFGIVDVGPLTPGALDVLEASMGWFTTVEVPPAGDRILDVRLPAPWERGQGVTVNVQVDDAQGEPWSGGPALLAAVGSSWALHDGVSGGACGFSDVPPGEYVLTLPATCLWPGRTRTVTVPIRVDEGKHTNLVVRPRAR